MVLKVLWQNIKHYMVSKEWLTRIKLGILSNLYLMKFIWTIVKELPVVKQASGILGNYNTMCES